MDFGSVQTLATQEGQTVTIVGTYGYMPPEQFSGRTVPASDLYSVGATLIALATGSHPADLPQTNLQIQFEAIAKFPPAFTSWLKQLIEPSLERRFASASTALAALNQLQQWHEQALGRTTTPIATNTIFLNAIVRNSMIGIFTGIVFGGTFGTGVAPILGTLIGGIFGGILGVMLGGVNGVMLATFTCWFFNPPKSIRAYRRFARISSFSFTATLVFVLAGRTSSEYGPGWTGELGFSIVVALIAGFAATLSGLNFAQWYEQKITGQEGTKW